MKTFIFAILVLSALQFSLGDDWEGLEDAITVQEDAALEIVDSLDLQSGTPFTQQIENQVQQLIKQPDQQIEEQEILTEQDEIHSVEYWLERLGDEYSDETILLQTPSITDQITSVIGNLILQGGDQLKEISQIQKEPIEEEPLIISGIELEFSEVQLQSTQLQELLNSAKEMQRNIAETDSKHNHKNPIIDIDLNDIMQQDQVDPTTDIQDSKDKEMMQQSNDSDINDQNNQNIQPQTPLKNVFQPNEEIINSQQTEQRLFNFLTGKQEETAQNTHKSDDNGYKFYSFNSNNDEQRPFYDDKESAMKFYEQELPKDKQIKVEEEKEVVPNKIEKQQQNSSVKEDKQDVQETSSLRKYLLYTEQPDVISTGSTDTEIKKDRELISAFKSMDTDQHWISAKKQNESQDLKYELFRNEKPKEIENKQLQQEKQENVKQQVDNPHKFISFKAEPSVQVPKQIETPKEVETPKSKYEQLPETKLQSKEEMKRDKEQRIKEMQSQIAEQLKNKKLQKKADSDDHVLGYEKEYIEWERATQPKTFQAEINFVMTSNNLRKKQNV